MRLARWLCLEGLFALACVERSTPAPAVAAIEPNVVHAPVPEAEPPLPPPPQRRLGSPSRWSTVRDQIVLRDGLGCAAWSLEGEFLESLADHDCARNSELTEPSWDRKQINVGDGERTFWSARIDGKQFECGGLRGRTKQGHYRALAFGVQVIETEDWLCNGLALLIESDGGELALELWNLESSKRWATHAIERSDAASETLAATWVTWDELTLAVMLDLRRGDARRVELRRWPREGGPPRMHEFPPAGAAGSVTGVWTDHDVVVVELEPAFTAPPVQREVWLVSLHEVAFDPVQVSVEQE